MTSRISFWSAQAFLIIPIRFSADAIGPQRASLDLLFDDLKGLFPNPGRFAWP